SSTSGSLSGSTGISISSGNSGLTGVDGSIGVIGIFPLSPSGSTGVTSSSLSGFSDGLPPLLLFPPPFVDGFSTTPPGCPTTLSSSFPLFESLVSFLSSVFLSSDLLSSVFLSSVFLSSDLLSSDLLSFDLLSSDFLSSDFLSSDLLLSVDTVSSLDEPASVTCVSSSDDNCSFSETCTTVPSAN